MKLVPGKTARPERRGGCGRRQGDRGDPRGRRPGDRARQRGQAGGGRGGLRGPRRQEPDDPPALLQPGRRADAGEEGRRVRGLLPEGDRDQARLRGRAQRAREPVPGHRPGREGGRVHAEGRGREPARTPKAQFQVGYASFNSGKYDEAVEAFKKAEALDPSNAEIQYYLGSIAIGQNNIAECADAPREVPGGQAPTGPNAATATRLLAALQAQEVKTAS